MNARTISSCLLRSTLLALFWLLSGQSAVIGAPAFVLQGQSQGITTWTSTTLLNWRELDYIPCGVSISGTAANGQAMTITFPHVNGTTPAFQDLVNFTASANVTIRSGPTLSDPVGADWSYALTIDFTGGTGSVEFFARLAAGAHLNTSSSLIIGSRGKMGQLQIATPISSLGAPDLSIVKSGPAVVAAADVVTYTLSYTNAATGTNDATGVQISEILPPELIATTHNLGGGSLVGNTIFWDLGTVSSGASGAVSFQAQVDPGLSNKLTTVTLTDFVQILSSENDSNYADNSSTCQTIVSSGCIPFSVGYPYSSSNPLTSISFNESDILRGFSTKLVGMNDSIKAWYNDEHALLLGIRRVVVKTATGTTTTDYPLTPLVTDPDGATNPAVGTLALAGDQAGTDLSNRPIYPALFVTDTTTNPNSTAGDWQFGGAAIPPHAVFGSWKSAVRTVDKTRSPAVVTITTDSDPTANGWNLAGGDPAPSGLTSEGYGAEVRWNVADLGLLPGHSYRLYFMIHDGDQNQSGGDAGQGGINIVVTGAIGPGNQTSCNGGTVTFNTVVSSLGTYYCQWLKNGIALPGQTSTNLVLSNISAADAGAYSAIVSSSCGSVTNGATLTVYQSVAISSPPVSSTNCLGAGATFNVSASGSSLSHQWGYDGSPIGGATDSSYTIPSIAIADLGTYDVVVSNLCSSVTSNPATLSLATPVAVSRNLTVQLDATGHATITPQQVNDGSTDACGIASLSLDRTSFDCSNAGPNTVTLTVTDNNGNSATCTATVTATVVPASVASSILLHSNFDLDANNGGADGSADDNHVTLPDSGPVDFSLTIDNTGQADLGIAIAGLPCSVDVNGDPIPRMVIIPAGGSTNFVCSVDVTCPNGTNFDVTVTSTAVASASVPCVFNAQSGAIQITSTCTASVNCEAPATCRVTGDGTLIAGTVDHSCIDVSTTIFPLVVNGLTVGKITHGGQLGAPFSQMDCGAILGNPCIRGQWQHTRHYLGEGNPRDVIEMDFHSVTSKGQFDSLSCACLGWCDPASGAFIPPTVGPLIHKFALCNPEDHKFRGPNPRRAPANAIIFSGVGKLTPTDDIQGDRPASAEWVVFNVYIEDRSGPGGSHPRGAGEPADIYCFQAWKTGIKVTRKPDFTTVTPEFRTALGQANCDFLNALSSGASPIGTLPSPTVNGVTADIQDSGPLHDGHQQIHPSTSATCSQ